MFYSLTNKGNFEISSSNLKNSKQEKGYNELSGNLIIKITTDP